MKAHIPSGIANESATPYALVWHCVRNFAELGNKLDRTHRVINFKLTTTASSSCRAQLTITEGPLLGYVAREISDTAPANLDHFSASSPARTTDQNLQAVDYAQLSAVFRGVCLRLHARLAALEAHLRPQSLNIT